MRWPVTTKVCVALAGPPARPPWTWVSSAYVPYCRACHRSPEHSDAMCPSSFQELINMALVLVEQGKNPIISNLTVMER